MEDAMKRTSILVLATAVVILTGQAGPRAAEPDLKVDRNCTTSLPEDQSKATATAKPEALSDSLAGCHGVLRPPAVGDDMSVPPPQSGAKTPVLPPGSVPEQTPKG